MRLSGFLALFLPVFLLAFPNASESPFVGRWDFNTSTPKGVGANWLGITQHGEKLDIWFQPTGGHVIQVPEYTANGSHLTLTVAKASNNRPAMVWELEPCSRWKADRAAEDW